MNRFRIYLGLGIFIFSVFGLIWALYPIPRINRIQKLQPILLQSPESTAVADHKSINLSPSVQASEPLIMDGQQLILVFPSQIRYGDKDIVQLVFQPINNETPVGFETVESLGFDPWGTHLEDGNKTYLALAEARLDLVGLDVRPSDLVSEPLHPGGSATFFWSIDPARVGSYQGTAWLYLRITDSSTGLETRKAISAQIIEIKVVDILGLSTTWVQVLAWIGMAAGVILGKPFIDELKGHYSARLRTR